MNLQLILIFLGKISTFRYRNGKEVAYLIEGYCLPLCRLLHFEVYMLET